MLSKSNVQWELWEWVRECRGSSYFQFGWRECTGALLKFGWGTILPAIVNWDVVLGFVAVSCHWWVYFAFGSGHVCWRVARTALYVDSFNCQRLGGGGAAFECLGVVGFAANSERSIE